MLLFSVDVAAGVKDKIMAANSRYYECTIPCTCANCKNIARSSQEDVDERNIILCDSCHFVYIMWADDLRVSGFISDWLKTSSAKKCKPVAM